jgi:hypothetical protein
MRPARRGSRASHPYQHPNLRQLGIPDRTAREWAASSKGYWRIAGSPVLKRALPNIHWDDLGLLGLQNTWRRLRTTA